MREKKTPPGSKARRRSWGTPFGLFLVGGGPLAQRGAEDVAQRRAGIGGPELGNRLLLLGHFQRLDRNADLARLLVELRHAGIDLLADRETLRALLGPVTGQIR